MIITKRDGGSEEYRSEKIKNAISLAFESVEGKAEAASMNQFMKTIEAGISKWTEENNPVHVEMIQDLVEKTLMECGFYEEAKSYILYRDRRTKIREERKKISSHFTGFPGISTVLKEIQQDFSRKSYSLEHLGERFLSFYSPEMKEEEKLDILIKAAVELTTQEAPRWELIAARLLMFQYEKRLEEQLQLRKITSFYDKLRYLTDQGLYGAYILGDYTKKEIEYFEEHLNARNNQLFTYSALDLLLKRYVIRTNENIPLETPQEMFMGIAMHLAIKEDDRKSWVLRFYHMLSSLQVTMATPTLSNARKPYHQLSSCFIDTVPDSLDGIYRSLDNFAKVSKFGGGMGMYFGKVRASGSDIRGFKGAAGGVIRWMKLVNDTAVAVDQLGMRQGAVAVYLDVWHKDIPEFLSLRTNNGDDRMKAHDIFPAVCYPDYFWEQAKENIEGIWYLMCPHEIETIKGYCLEDCYGSLWKERYLDCVNDVRISKRSIPVKELVRLIIKSAVETGTPFIFNRDHINNANPNAHKGMIYCSNLCTEIAQNMSPVEQIEREIEEINGEKIIVERTRPGDFVVCNLASLSLGRIPSDAEEKLQEIVSYAVRALDNVIDLNYFPLPYAKVTNRRYRSIGLGVSGYHHMLASKKIAWESEEHLKYVDDLFEKINYAVIKASSELAAEKGSYQYFEGSGWETGSYFEKRKYTSARWQELQKTVKKNGMRNGYLLAVAPTSSTSIIAGTTAGLDPIMNRYFLEEKKNGLVPRVAPDLSMENFWLYKNAHNIDQMWSVKACGIRQRHIDQAQSMNLYITNEYTFRGVLDLYLSAWEQGVKTIYYIRSKSLEVEECESCSS